MDSAPGKPASQRPHVFAIVPAAGRSQRMGSPKQLIEVAGRPLLVSVAERLAAADVSGVLVVTRSEIAAAIGLDESNRETRTGVRPMAALVHVVINDDPATEMIDSVRIGVRWWAAQTAPASDDGYLVCPADHAGISSADVSACVAAYRAASDSIIVAAYRGRRGHPLIFPATLADFVYSNACAAGLNALPRAHPARVKLVECGSASVVDDVDTPADLQQFARRAHP